MGASVPARGVGVMVDKDGGQAFPRHTSFGMSLRDYFAGCALGAVVAEMQSRSDGFDEERRDATDAAVKSYAIADAMLKARDMLKAREDGE